MHMIRHDYCSVQTETFAVSPEAGFQGNASSGGGEYPAMVGRKRGKDRRAVALKVWEMAAIFVFPFHASTNTTLLCTGEDARAYILFCCSGMGEMQGAGHARRFAI